VGLVESDRTEDQSNSTRIKFLFLFVFDFCGNCSNEIFSTYLSICSLIFDTMPAFQRQQNQLRVHLYMARSRTHDCLHSLTITLAQTCSASPPLQLASSSCELLSSLLSL
jgi:hypothetical protein